MWTIVSILLVVLLAAIAVLLILSPGKPKPILDQSGRRLAGSIAEKIHIPINGTEQGMFLRGRDPGSPVLLYLHGGPGMPTYFLNQRYPTKLGEDFIVCWWEQRGTGLSYRAGIPPDTVTIEQLISDTLAVTNYLRERFGKDKLYLMGQSWGSFIGIQAAARFPEVYQAYIGVAQIANQLESEKLAYEFMLDQYRQNGNRKMLQRLENAPPPTTIPLSAAYMSLRDPGMHPIGIGTTHDMTSVITGVFLPVWLNREYTLLEKANIWRGKWSATSRRLWNQMLATDLTSEVTRLEIPTYFFHGIYDYTCSYTLARSYFNKIEAPVKGFYTFEKSAHSPIFEEPERTQRIIRADVLPGANSLSDMLL